MRIKGLTDEDFVNYKLPSMFISTNTCTFKCDKDAGSCVCQNSELAKTLGINIVNDELIRRYIHNPITKAIVFGGLEPFDQFSELFEFIRVLRLKYKCDDTVVIYTGYNEDEITVMTAILAYRFQNIIVKFGRFIPDSLPNYDELLGVKLASDNQYAKQIS